MDCKYVPDYRHYGLNCRDFVLQMLENIKPPFQYILHQKYFLPNLQLIRDVLDV